MSNTLETLVSLRGKIEEKIKQTNIGYRIDSYEQVIDLINEDIRLIEETNKSSDWVNIKLNNPGLLVLDNHGLPVPIPRL